VVLGIIKEGKRAGKLGQRALPFMAEFSNHVVVGQHALDIIAIHVR
jgi:hypothetical protein